MNTEMTKLEDKTLSKTQRNFLVNTKTNSNKTLCGRWLLVGPKDKEGLYPYLKIFCNCYGCSVCGARKRWRVCKAIAEIIKERNLRVFATLTIIPESCRPEDSVKFIKKTWNKHRTYQKRDLQRPPSFISVVEFQKNTRNAHLHVLLDDFVPFKWLDQTWRAVGGGRVNVKEANVRAASYMSKYLTKEMDSEIYGKFRRISTSRDIKLLPKRSNPEFECLEMSDNDAKFILGESVIKEIKWGSDLITGFLATRRLPVFKTPLILGNVAEVVS